MEGPHIDKWRTDLKKLTQNNHRNFSIISPCIHAKLLKINISHSITPINFVNGAGGIGGRYTID
jgi:hypothetical protein